MDDSSAGDKSAAAVKYLLSREECQQYCDEYPGCEVVVYKPLACRIFEDGVEPVDDVGWTFLRKSCRGKPLFCRYSSSLLGRCLFTCFTLNNVDLFLFIVMIMHFIKGYR